MAWQNGQASAMPGHLDPAQMYSNINNNSPFDISQFTSGLQNAASTTPTPPSFPSQGSFQPGQVIPAKRPHDGTPSSRSQTPNFGGAYPNQPYANAPNPYAHLQQQSGSSNATPSPTMQNQHRPTPQPQQQSRMQNASPSPFPQQQQQVSFGGQQTPNQPTGMPQQNPMANFNQQFGMSNTMGMPNMSGAGAGQAGNNANMRSAQQLYQQRLMMQQAQLRNSGMIGQRATPGQPNQMVNNAGQQRGNGQMPNGQAAGAMNANMALAQHQKRASFLNTLRNHTTSQGKPFDEHPNIGGRPVDYLALWQLTTQLGGSQAVDRNNQWAVVATKLGFHPTQYPTAPEELKQLHAHAISQYERMWFQAKQAQNKQEQARMHAHQMAGLGGPDQASPTKMMPGGNQQNQYNQYQQNQQLQPQATPVQANAQLPQNGLSTPQQQMLHRRSSSLRKPEQMTPQNLGVAMAVGDPQSAGKIAQRSPSVHHEATTAALIHEQPQSKEYVPAATTVEYDGGLDVIGLLEFGTAIARSRPDMPTLHEAGLIDTRAIMLSLASGLHAEVRYALDMLAMLSKEDVKFELEQCEDLMDVIVDCAEEQVEQLSDDAAEVSDALDLAPYEDIVRLCRIETESLQEVHAMGTQAYDLDRAADRVIAITTILRNFSFYEHNHRLLTQSSLLKWLSNTIRLLGTRNMLLRTFYNTQDFYKDMIVFLSNVTQSLELPSRDDALHILHFLLAFAPQPAPSYDPATRKVSFASFSPSTHRYLPPAVDCLAKLLARQDPNRLLYKSIFNASASSLAISESPLDLLTRAFGLAISVLPDRASRVYGNQMLHRTVEARKAYLTQGMLAADILTSLMPVSEPDLARAWLRSEDGWAVGLFSLCAVLSVDKSQGGQQGHLGVGVGGMKGRMGEVVDTETPRGIAHRGLAVLGRLSEKAGKIPSRSDSNGVTNGEAESHGGRGEEEDDQEWIEEGRKWEGVPHAHAIVGAAMMGQGQVDKTSLRLLCGLFDLAMQS